MDSALTARDRGKIKSWMKAAALNVWLLLEHLVKRSGLWVVRVLWNDGTEERVGVIARNEAEAITNARAEAYRGDHWRKFGNTVTAYVTWEVEGLSWPVTEIYRVPWEEMDPVGRVRELAYASPFYGQNREKARIAGISIGERLDIKEVSVVESAVGAPDEEIRPRIKIHLSPLMNKLRGAFTGKLTFPELISVATDVVKEFTDELCAYTEDPGLERTLTELIVQVSGDVFNEWGLRQMSIEALQAEVKGGLEYKFVTKKDEKTCPVCKRMDGFVVTGDRILEKFPFAYAEDGKVYPQAHPHCRCELVVG